GFAAQGEASLFLSCLRKAGIAAKPTARLQVQFHEPRSLDRIVVIRFNVAETYCFIEPDGPVHLPRNRIETHSFVSDGSCFSDDCLNQDLSESRTPKFRANKEPFHFAGVRVQ